jgi:DNA-binding FadR family transcriptional regulator
VASTTVNRPVSARLVAFSVLEPNSAVEMIVRRLGEAIGAGVLVRGERLPSETELADQLGVAPMTVRQALAILREAGFIETRRGRQGGSFVRDDAEEAISRISVDDHVLTLSHLRDLTDWRRAVSGEAAWLAAERADTADVEALRQADRATHELLPTFESYRIADGRLHVLIAELSRSPRLVVAETQIQATLSAFVMALPRTATATKLSDDQHRPVVRAIAGGRPAAARKAMIDHVEATYEWVIGLRLGHLNP